MPRRKHAARWPIMAAVALTLSLPVFAWKEFTTHFWMTQETSKNSHGWADFLSDTRLGPNFRIDYGDPLVQNHTAALRMDPRNNGARGRLNTQVFNFITQRFDALGCAMLGSIHEDVSAGAQFTPGWRWTRHFYDPVDQKGLDYGVVSGMASPNWAAGDDTRNFYSYPVLVNLARLGWTETDALVRRRFQFLLFYSVGHQQHLVQDLLQPSHSRNDAHIGNDETDWAPAFARRFLSPSPLEEWGGGNQKLGKKPVVPIADPVVPTFSKNFLRYFSDAARSSNRHFFSEDTINFENEGDAPGRGDYFGPQRGETNWDDLRRDYDGPQRVRLRDAPPLVLERKAVPGLPGFGAGYGVLSPACRMRYFAAWNRDNRMRRSETLNPFNEDFMFSMFVPNEQGKDDISPAYCRQLIPRAAQHTVALVDFIFRGRLGVDVGPAGKDGRFPFRVWNNSTPNPGDRPRPDAEDLAWVSGTVRLYWELRPPVAPPQAATLQLAVTVPTPILVGGPAWVPGGPGATVLVNPPTPLPGLVAGGLRAWWDGEISSKRDEKTEKPMSELGFAAGCDDLAGVLPPGSLPYGAFCGGD